MPTMRLARSLLVVVCMASLLTIVSSGSSGGGGDAVVPTSINNLADVASSSNRVSAVQHAPLLIGATPASSSRNRRRLMMRRRRKMKRKDDSSSSFSSNRGEPKPTTMNNIMIMFRRSLDRRRRQNGKIDDSSVQVGVVISRGGAQSSNEEENAFDSSTEKVASMSNSSNPNATLGGGDSNETSSRSTWSIWDINGLGSSSSSSTSSDGPSPSSLVERWTREKLQFLDRIALVASSILNREDDAHLETAGKKVEKKKRRRRRGKLRRRMRRKLGDMLPASLRRDHAGADAVAEDEEYGYDDVLEDNMGDLSSITLQSDLTLPGRHFYVVTTAALPWFTGTAVNPLLRAAHLHRRTQQINQGYSHHEYRFTYSNSSNASSIDAELSHSLQQPLVADDSVQHNNSTGSSQQEQDQQQAPHRWVTLVIPWLELPEDQHVLYGQVFETPAAQEAYIRNWLQHDADMADAACPDTGLQILWYPARYHGSLRSIFAMGDIMNLMEPSKMDVAILEEPEHCNWFRAPGDGWTKRFHYVVGIVHTNYKEYASSQYSGLWTAPAIQMMSSAMVRAYCHKVIKLSDTLQTYAPEKECTSNVHGVRAEFLQQGLLSSQPDEREVTLTSSSSQQQPTAANTNKAYFIGKLLWAKGLDLMLDLEDYYRQCTGEYFAIDIYGNGPDEGDIKRAFHGRQGMYLNSTMNASTEEASSSGNDNNEESSTAATSVGTDLWEGLPFLTLPDNLEAMAKQQLAKLPRTFSELRRQPIPATFPGRVDHAQLKDYKIFVNPSISEVLCTTTAEALAMGKFVIIPVHPSNTFFLKFPNCLAYRTKFEFVANLRWALTHEPEPLTPELAREFTWEAATDRLIQKAAITRKEALERERLGLSKLDQRIAWFHNELGKGMTGDMLRKIFGAGPASQQVRYEMAKQGQSDGGDASTKTTKGQEEDDESKEDQDDGLSRKFRRSSFAEAMRAALSDISSFAIQ